MSRTVSWLVDVLSAIERLDELLEFGSSHSLMWMLKSHPDNDRPAVCDESFEDGIDNVCPVCHRLRDSRL